MNVAVKTKVEFFEFNVEPLSVESAVFEETYPEYITNKQIKSVSSLQEHIFKNFIESQA